MPRDLVFRDSRGEVYKLIAHMIDKRNSAESLEIRKAIHELINFWEGNRPLNLVTS